MTHIGRSNGYFSVLPYETNPQFLAPGAIAFLLKPSSLLASYSLVIFFLISLFPSESSMGTLLDAFLSSHSGFHFLSVSYMHTFLFISLATS